MGADIHGTIEYFRDYGSDHSYWDCLAEVFLSRSYATFELLAGVRGDIENAVVPPRGLPENLSGWTIHIACLYVHTDNGEGRITLDNALDYVKRGQSQWVDEDHTYITDPDYHTFSWLTAKEVREVWAKRPNNQELYAIAAMMSALGNIPVRFVFWFDN